MGFRCNFLGEGRLNLFNFSLCCPSRKIHPSLFCLHLAAQSATLSSLIIGSFLEPSAVFYADFLNSLPSHSISSGFSIDAFDGDYRSTSTARRTQPDCPSTQTAPERSVLLGSLVQTLEQVARCPGHRQTRNCHHLASPWLSALLEVEIEGAARRASEDGRGDPRTDPTDVA